ncbi:MAG: hypothetical protein D8M61_00905 [Ignavibacteriae bacterium]|nr:hypothetical protein [Ignavibacteriota bacterium]
MGYDVNPLENDRYEISRNFSPFDNGEYIQIKTIIDLNNSFPEKSEINKDGVLVSEQLNQVNGGKRIVYSKIYRKNSIREQKNFITKSEFE